MSAWLVFQSVRFLALCHCADSSALALFCVLLISLFTSVKVVALLRSAATEVMFCMLLCRTLPGWQWLITGTIGESWNQAHLEKISSNGEVSRRFKKLFLFCYKIVNGFGLKYACSLVQA